MRGWPHQGCGDVLDATFPRTSCQPSTLAGVPKRSTRGHIRVCHLIRVVRHAARLVFSRVNVLTHASWCVMLDLVRPAHTLALLNHASAARALPPDNVWTRTTTLVGVAGRYVATQCLAASTTVNGNATKVFVGPVRPKWRHAATVANYNKRQGVVRKRRSGKAEEQFIRETRKSSSHGSDHSHAIVNVDGLLTAANITARGDAMLKTPNQHNAPHHRMSFRIARAARLRWIVSWRDLESVVKTRFQIVWRNAPDHCLVDTCASRCVILESACHACRRLPFTADVGECHVQLPVIKPPQIRHGVCAYAEPH